MAASSASSIRTNAWASDISPNWGHYYEVVCDFTPSTSYPANGEPMTPTLFNLREVQHVFPLPPVDGSRLVTWDRTNKTLRIFTALSTEAGTGTDQSAKVIPLVVIGTLQ